MIQIFAEYWRPFLYSDGLRASGLVVTLWLLAASLALGFCAAVPLACARVSRNRWLATPVRLYTFVFRGTPLYVQLLLLYTGMYSIRIVRRGGVALCGDFVRAGGGVPARRAALARVSAAGRRGADTPRMSRHISRYMSHRSGR